MMSNGPKDAMVAFGVIMTIMTVWSTIETFKAKNQMEAKSKNLDTKLNLILARLPKT